MNDIQEKKKQLRQKMKQMQNSLTETYIDDASKTIQERIIRLPKYKEADSIFVYVSTPREPQTVLLIETALKEGKKVYVPKCINSTEMLAVRIDSFEELKPGMMGLLEPEHITNIQDADRMDLILVPCLCASLDGRRLGHGAGCYDRFLEGCHNDLYCLCFQKMLSDEIVMDENDLYMTEVITE